MTQHTIASHKKALLWCNKSTVRLIIQQKKTGANAPVFHIQTDYLKLIN